jgi:hypothetical protein
MNLAAFLWMGMRPSAGACWVPSARSTATCVRAATCLSALAMVSHRESGLGRTEFLYLKDISSGD